ncbi:MAG: hypothetical protein AB7P23_01810 [Amphiplicatus sp.]
MPHKFVKDALEQHFLTLFGFAAAEDGVAGDATLTFRALRNDEEPDEPKSREEADKVHVYLEFEPSIEDGAGLGLAGYEGRHEEGLFYVHAIAAAGKGDAALDDVWRRIKHSLRIPMIADVIHISQRLIEGDKGLRHGGRWIGYALSGEFAWDFDSAIDA